MEEKRDQRNSRNSDGPAKDKRAVELQDQGAPFVAKLLAHHDSNGITFQARLSNIEQREYGDENVYMLHFCLNFMNPLSSKKRIRGAELVLKLIPSTEDVEPRLLFVRPIGALFHVSDREVTVGERVSIGASADGGPAGVNMTVEGSGNATTKFKGIRIIQGIVKNERMACWRMYEEPGCRSALPQQVKLIAVIQSQGRSWIEVDRFLVKVHDHLRFWKLNRVHAIPEKKQEIPPLDEIIQRVRAANLQKAVQFAKKTKDDIIKTYNDVYLLEKELGTVLEDKMLQELLDKGDTAQGKLQLVQDVFRVCQTWLNSLASSDCQKNLRFFSVQQNANDVQKAEEWLKAKSKRKIDDEKQPQRRPKAREVNVIRDKTWELEAKLDLLKKMLELHELKKKAEDDGLQEDEVGNYRILFPRGEAGETAHDARNESEDEGWPPVNYCFIKPLRPSEPAYEHHHHEANRVLIAPEHSRYGRSRSPSSRSRSRSPRRKLWNPPKPGQFLGMGGTLTQSELDDFSPVGPGYKLLHLA